jgi:hypothetical protein
MTSTSLAIFFVLITGVVRTFMELATKLVILPAFVVLDTWVFLEASVADSKGACGSDGEVALAPLE